MCKSLNAITVSRSHTGSSAKKGSVYTRYPHSAFITVSLLCFINYIKNKTNIRDNRVIFLYNTIRAIQREATVHLPDGSRHIQQAGTVTYTMEV